MKKHSSPTASRQPFRRPSWLHKSIALLLAVQMACPRLTYAADPVLTAVTVSAAFDGNGNVTSRLDGNGAATAITYDAMNRVTAIDYPGGASPDVTFTYDAQGNRTRMVDATGTTDYRYDLFDRLTAIDYPDGGFVRYGYDYGGNVTKMRYGNTKTSTPTGGGFTEIDYTYDEDNRIATVRNVFANTTTSYTYNDAGLPLRRTLPNGVTTDYDYDGDGRLLSVDHKKADTTRICRYVYILNAIGNRTQVVETLPDGSTKTTAYTYDPLDRLSTATYPDGRSVTYLYDTFGNRTRMTEVTGAVTKVTDYLYDGDSRLLSTKINNVPDETFRYDTTGNLIQRVRASDNRQIDYAYDYENRLVRYFDGTNNVQYIYDGAGRRVAKVSNGVRTNYVNDLNRKYVQVLTETDPSGNAKRVYEWGNELIDQVAGSTRAYHLHDAINGNIRRVTDSIGAIANSYEYDAFGKPTTKIETLLNDYQYQGEVQEEETGGVYLRNRILDPEIGRFLTRDNLNRGVFHPLSFNPYTFAESDPINHRDPGGTRIVYDPPGGGAVLADSMRIWTATTHGSSLYNSALTDSMDYTIHVLSPGDAYGSCNHACAMVKGYDMWIDPTFSFLAYTNKGIQRLDQPEIIGHEFGHMGPNGVDDAPRRGDMMQNVRTNENPITKELYGWQRTSYVTSPNFFETVGYYVGRFFSLIAKAVGGVALNKSASVLLDINNITGGTYDAATGQIILFGKQDNSPTALPKMSLDDLAVAVRAKQLGTFPVVSIEPPIVSNPPEWPGRTCNTVRYGPLYTDTPGGTPKVLDVASKTHFGWVMFEADRLLKSLVLGKDNRTLQSVRSNIPGYASIVELNAQNTDLINGAERFWFNPKEIVVESSADGKSMQITKAEMQLSTESAFASGGQVEGSPSAQYFASWFTNNYDALAEEQVSYDDANQPHKIYKELKQLAYLAGVVKWIDDNDIPVDLTFLKDYQPAFFAAAPVITPITTASTTRNYGGGVSITFTITGGVSFCNDLVLGTGGNPTGLGAAAVATRPAESALAWTFSNAGNTYNASALSLDRTEKDGGSSQTAIDAQFQVNGTMPLTLGRYFDSFNVTPTLFGWGWQAQPYALEFKGSREVFSLCHQTWSGYGEVWFRDRATQAAYQFIPSGIYDKTADPQGLASRFDPTKDILVYRHQNRTTPGLLYSDNTTRMTMKLDSGALLDFDLDGVLTRVEDRNGNRLDYAYDVNRRLISIGQAGGRSISLSYNAQNRVTSAALPGGRTVTYIYNGTGDLISAQADAPTGWIAKYGYDANHSLTQVQDESGAAAATQTIDVYGRVTGIAQPGVATPLAETYSLANRTSQQTGPNGLSRTTEYNTNHDPTKVTDSRGNFTTMTYNNFREMVSMQTPDNQTRQFYVDAAGHRVATALPNGRADRALFDDFGNPTVTYHSPVDAMFNESFDADHVMTAIEYASYATNYTQYTYDAKGNPTGITDALSHTRTFGRDARGNMTFAKDGRGKQTDYTYGSNSHLTRVRNAMGHQVDLTYDTRDNLTQVATLAGTVDYTYNSKNQVASVTTGNAGARRTTSYTYNAKGQLATVTDPNGKVTAYTYDARGNLIEIIHDGLSRFTYDYDGLNRRTGTHYTGSAGGARPSLVPTSPVGGEQFGGGAPITIRWSTQGDWTGNANVTLQYSTDGITWIAIATVNSATGLYVWNSPPASNTLRLRFVRTGDSTFRNSTTAIFSEVAATKYYVNDTSTAGDQYCTEAGQTYNGTTITGRTPGNPVNDPQAIIDNNVLHPGDIVYIDTGNYSLNHDFVLNEADSGTATLPVTIQGPTSGFGAVITRTVSANANNAVIFVRDTNPADTNTLQGIVVQNLTTIGGRRGIFLADATYCVVRNNDCHHNRLDGAASQAGDGSGILLSGGGFHIVDSNLCHENGGNGGAGSGAGSNGGTGLGFGILVVSSVNNVIEHNNCYGNGGAGGAAGSATGTPGNSQFVGIQVTSAASQNNEISDNSFHDHVSQGVTTSSGNASRGTTIGISVLNAVNTKILRNTIYALSATGGSTTSANGGTGNCNGINCSGGTGTVISGNRIFNNHAYGGLGATSSTAYQNGEADCPAIWITSTPNVVASNNVGFDNSALSYDTRSQEKPGAPYAGGIWVSNSQNGRVMNNTFFRNRLTINTGRAPIGNSGQIFVFSTSTGATIKNNVCVSFDPFCPAIAFDTTSQPGAVVDFNDLHSQGGNVGVWGSNFYSTLAAWKAGTGQDTHSLSVDPRFYDTASNNFHLRSDSALIEAGTPLADVLTDGDGESRPANGPNPVSTPSFDIGYDEFVDSDGDTLPDIIESTVTLTNVNDGDSDHEGLGDAWEVANTLNPNDATGVNGASGDADGDGYTNLQEYLGNSNPRLATSIPSLPPFITSALPTDANPFILEEDGISFSATATDANSDPIAYAWYVDNVLKSSLGTYAFTTTNISSGQTTLSKAYAVQLRVTAGGAQVTRSWTVTVGNRNHAPVFQPMSNLRARPGQTIQLNPAFSDADNQNSVPGDDNTLAVSYSGFMTSASKTLTTADLGQQSVTITVQDNGNPPLNDQQTILINVINAGAAITSSGATTIVTEGGAAVTYTVALTGQPAAPVSIGVAADNQLGATPTLLTFTGTNWATPQTVSLTAPNNHIAQGNRAGAVLHSASSTDLLFNGIAISSLAVTIKDAPIDEWRFQKFTAGERANPAISGDSADPNRNGIPNVMEYALGGDPKGSTTGVGILPRPGRGMGNTLQLLFNRLQDRADLTLTVKAADLPNGPWTDLAQSVTGQNFTILAPGAGVAETGTGNTRSVTVSDLFSVSDPAHPRRFIKLEVRVP